MRYADAVLKEITSNPSHLADYQTALDLLTKSRVFDYLRAAAVPLLVNGGLNVHQTAAQGAHAVGYNKCLDDIFTFREQVVTLTQKKPTNLAPDFGAAGIALSSKHLTQEEIDAINRGESPRYDPKTGKFKSAPDK